MEEELHWHYTNQNGVIGIFESKSIWATNIKYMNDENEFQHTLDMIVKVISEIELKSARQYISQIVAEIEHLDEYKSISIFTASFSKEADLLSQWRGYCPNNNGYSLGFCLNSIYEAAKKKHGSNAHLFDCVYDMNAKEKLIKTKINDYWIKYSKEPEESKQSIIKKLISEIILLATHFKHPSFSEEKEKRIVLILDNSSFTSIKFRAGTYSIIPYVKLKAEHDSIKRVIVGPCSNQKLSERSLELFIESNTGKSPLIFGPFISISETTYRV